MSRSYHATFSQLKGKTKRQLDEMTQNEGNRTEWKVPRQARNYRRHH